MDSVRSSGMKEWSEDVRLTGRHRKGTSPVPVHPGNWDVAERAAAGQLDLVEPGWMVSYGVGTRRYFAIATWPAPAPLIVEAPTTDELRARMREAEREVVHHITEQRSPGASAAGSFRGAAMPETPEDLRTVCWDVPHDLAVVGRVRGEAAEVLRTWVPPDLAADVVLVVGELLANAIGHGLPPVRVSLWLTAGELCVRVTDHGPERPRQLNLGLEAVHGRGLAIVDALAHDSGTNPLRDSPGKTVWARWRLARPETRVQVARP
ncbi:hypothetical protein Ssi03_47250 [Sphaerisporangium siamense]|uniref:Anti-sigma regulatory factor (Ser/Thr protein kinase) n=1 Tax=Sphaerisporangium siamense TaxID=795645 RepID=A0A7W7D554_9ACTN|nr:ATP-binding protein [Sphaerisporangium siamense]MBB4699138.1 anti-sigma regulatory factor (Ser/Thr protein kinase) [Sphaerisporangium siamense]GII86735.1 hypothetical protein Ssi03_47250 [Sphaerisporangium siamense]